MLFRKSVCDLKVRRGNAERIVQHRFPQPLWNTDNPPQGRHLRTKARRHMGPG